MWKYIGENGQNIVGVPATDMTDEEFKKTQSEYEAGFPGCEPGVLERSGLWEHMSEKQYKAEEKAEAEAVAAEEKPQ